MQFTESWLKSLVDITLPTAELAEKLTMAGLEVEELHPVAPPFTGVVVAQVLEKNRTPMPTASACVWLMSATAHPNKLCVVRPTCRLG